ncbi:MAG: aminomuconate-semialdehyde/2-hydroxymuconate-6-semialdehyde dehydrogenase [Bradymonadia bacterium]|jgi:aminomuconate-semialdehyde/2-hydroxymuconate-6-semialdehyde dehydrogenase
MATLPLIPLYVDGAFRREPVDTFPNHDPTTGRVSASVALATRQDVDDAVASARRALHGPWGSMSVAARCDLLDRVADGVMARFEEFLEAEVRDTGKPRSFAERVDIPRGAANFRFFASMMRGDTTASSWTDTPDGRGALNYAMRTPLGVVGVICPWNLPLLLMTWKVAPALAVGNCVVVKPSEETPRTATLLAEVMHDVGVPAGVFNVVHGFGPDSAGQFITQHEGIDAITFTGETRTGTAIMKDAAEHMKAVSFELGGKNAAIVFEDCDLDAAVAGTLRSAFSNCGQVCLCSERVYVHRSIFEAFVERLAAQTKEMKIGSPLDPATAMGPLISGQQRDKVQTYLERAVADGATVHAGGKARQMAGDLAGGYWLEPTIWTGLDQKSACIQEEIFGPVCHVMPFDHEDEAIALANDSKYGLCAAVWTQGLARAHRVARQLEVGLVWVNDWFLRDLRTPFGGVKLSGIGREGGHHSLDFYSEHRNICIKL